MRALTARNLSSSSVVVVVRENWAGGAAAFRSDFSGLAVSFGGGRMQRSSYVHPENNGPNEVSSTNCFSQLLYRYHVRFQRDELTMSK